ncbi:NAD(P)H-dependent oxidoreductase [Paracidovorax citrulli]|uniref:NAD(P)H-dependent oxidoreductase n=1 Tax=Paracidovorax citrulli TaxID=80869 RepID=UPI000313A248|nr:NAD(P)H-dependent oxidoreductase [Paracidovorax citrulli]QCX09529.1 Glutathione-regulated potassium-efflux system ancillary protein KefF [Paracidovorax citrulli]UEG47496.1 NAD(P)H-dependent oxidoreductase [Paracidovorax citrulli]UMT96033.1 NAD(P)H-dependent oxidoreductase [Paracidovorax citrulli]
MHALIVVSHPDPRSLTHAVARSFAEGVEAPGQHTTEVADIAAEGFQPAFNPADRATFFMKASAPPDVLREQERIDRSDALVLVYPVYWWSFPGQLKGWIDRVFSNGWAYSQTPEGAIEKRLGRLAVHLLGIGGADEGTYARHGYDKALRTQIDHGIFDYCGARVATSTILHGTDGASAASHIATARELGRNAFARQVAAGGHPAPEIGGKFGQGDRGATLEQ